MEKRDLPNFVNYLIETGNVWGPIRRKRKHVFDRIKSYNELDLSYQRTLLPIKKFFLPQKQLIFEFNILEQDAYITPKNSNGKKIIMGLHPCDIHALRIQDKFNMEGEFIDPFYTSLRNNTVIIGFSCLPDENCFCNNTNTSNATYLSDIFITELEDYYLISYNSPQGEEIISALPNYIYENVGKEGELALISWSDARDKLFIHKHKEVFGIMKTIMDQANDLAFWDDLGDLCLSCGACTSSCPTCGCYNVEDTVNVDGTGKREKSWDSCQLPIFSQVAGGIDFRSSRASRLKLYFTHKLVEFNNEPSCVGCGRCIEACPVDINILSVVRNLKRVII